MNTRYLYILFITSCLCFNTQAQTIKDLDNKRVKLPNGWGLSPAGKQLPLGDLPLNIAISPSKRLLAVTHGGQSDQSIYLIDALTQTVLDTIKVGKAWMGLCFAGDERTLYASGGNDNFILGFDISRRQLVPRDTIVLGKPWPERISPTGIAIDDARHILYVVTKENNSLYTIDLFNKRVINTLSLPGEAYTCILSTDRRTLFVSIWGADKIIMYDTDTKLIKSAILVGDNPNDMCVSKNGSFLYVANANDNSVSVISIKQRKVIETLNAALYPNAPIGSTTNSVALSTDDQTLYIANADNNCLAVYDVMIPGLSRSMGYIPTGWYPTCVRTIGNTIYVANGKGLSSHPNPLGPNPTVKRDKSDYQKGEAKDKVQYIGGLMRGTLSIIPEPDDKILVAYSQAVYANTAYKKQNETITEGHEGNPIPRKVGDASPIKYVFYIIKENRTYDQILADVPGGNGDTSLLLFGEKCTPNQHALVKDYVLLDNFYANGEVSADGHNWSTAAYATDYLEKTWPSSYGGRGGGYDAEGNRATANGKGGFIWDYCKKYGISYRSYGEFVDDYKPNIPVLKGHFCPYYTGWDPAVADTTRYSQWRREFDSLLATHSVPQFNTLRLVNDHTEGLKKGRPTPFAHVADNDLAVGLMIDHLSHSAIWRESVVFIVEDDAQNGADHVDAHRTTAYVAGPHVKRGLVDHTMYSTSSMLRTMELILGLPAMSQYDAAATPMWRCFTDSAVYAPFEHRSASINLHDVNTAMNEWSIKSEGFDFRAEDRVPDGALNEMIWIAVRGELATCPAPIHAAFFKPSATGKDDDD
jgi:YVTN family beta-propeller protein